MQYMTSAAFSALRVVTRALCLSNEFILLTSSWIISPSLTSPSADAIPLPPPAWTTIVYAIAEPVFVWLFQKARVGPWIFLINTPHHLWVCEIAAAYLSRLRASHTRSPEGSLSMSEEWGPRSPFPRDAQYDKAWKVCLAILGPVLSAAASNAALLMFGCIPDGPVEEKALGLLLLFGWLGFIFYLGSRYGDVRIGKMSQRWPLWEHEASTRVSGYLLCICALLAIKSTTRFLLGLHTFPLVSGLEPTSLELDVPSWVSWTNASTPVWVRLATIIAPLPLSYIGAVLLRYATRNAGHQNTDRTGSNMIDTEPKFTSSVDE